jgi:recombinational DNA repair ATPase RecF
MNTELSVEELIEPLQTVIGVVEKKQTLPILSHVLIQLSENTLTLTTTDMELEISASSKIKQKKTSIVFWMLQVLALVENQKKPVVLVDDISSELDELKIKSIIDFLTDVKVQIFMTDIGNKKLPLSEKKSSTFNIKNGVITAF